MQHVGYPSGRLIMVLFDSVDLKTPLGTFQRCQLDLNDETGSKAALVSVVKQFNESASDGDGQHRYDSSAMEKQLERCWSEFWIPYTALPRKTNSAGTSPSVPSRSSSITPEIGGVLREIAESLSEIRRSIAAQSDSAIRHAKVAPPIEMAMPSFIAAGNCPTCNEPYSVQILDRAGQTRTLKCAKCESVIYVHRLPGRKVFARAVNLEATNEKPTHKWRRFLAQTQAWVDPDALEDLAALAIEISGSAEHAGRLTPYELFQQMCLRVGTGAVSAMGRSTVRRFIKLVLSGGGFRFTTEVRDGPIWRKPITNTLDWKTIVCAYSRAIVIRLRNQFLISKVELPELAALLFPAEMSNAKTELEKIMAEDLPGKGLTEPENPPT